MGVIYLGDRAVGKTHLALELANTDHRSVKVNEPSYDQLKGLLEVDAVGPKSTQAIDDRPLEIEANLPAGDRNVVLNWVDTPGEMWRPLWQEDNAESWQTFLDNSKTSEGILLILNPFREMLLPKFQIDPEVANGLSNKSQWCRRFERWVTFFQNECPKARHIVICLNKADLFVNDLEKTAEILAYRPNGANLSWGKRHTYVLQRQFRPIYQQIEQINQSRSGLSVQCFITSIYNRDLLELPWVYLASFLAD